MHAHGQAARSTGSGEHLLPVQLIRTKPRLYVINRGIEAQRDIAFLRRGRRHALAYKGRGLCKAVKGAHHRGGGADLRHQGVHMYVFPAHRASFHGVRDKGAPAPFAPFTSMGKHP